MNMKKTILAASVAACVPVMASAMPWSQGNEPYVSGAIGYNHLHESDFDGPGANVEADFEDDWTDAWSALGAFGYRMDNGLRTELEIGYRNNEIKSLDGLANSNGDLRTWSFMANVLYDFMRNTRYSSIAGFTPYIGVGIGALNVNANSVAATGLTRIDDNTWTAGAQGIIGASYRVSERVDVFANYQYLQTLEYELENDASADIDNDYKASTFSVGVAYAFGPRAAAPVQYTEPAPAPKVAPQPRSRSYLVFFDFDKSNITSEASRIIDTAVGNAKQGDVIRIEVTGHADRSGTDTYNMGLSERRAQAVKAELVRRGFNAAEIVTMARGEREPLVPTEDGVREPQNRRVEIVYTTAGGASM